MRVRKVAVLLDGAFFHKRLRVWPSINRDDPKAVAEAARWMCKRHVQKLIGEPRNKTKSAWLDHVYRLFYYDAEPYEGAPFHPLLGRQVDFGKSPKARFSRELFDEIRRKRKFALRLGTVKRDGDWAPYNRHQKSLLKLWHHADDLVNLLNGKAEFDDGLREEVLEALQAWTRLKPEDIYHPMKQKGVDMKIGLDITSMTLKRQVDTIILVTGDSDFIPAAKVARREGVEFILDPMFQSVDDDLMEHIDGLTSGFDRPGTDVQTED